MKLERATKAQRRTAIGIGDQSGFELVTRLHTGKAPTLIDGKTTAADQVVEKQSTGQQANDLKQAAMRRAKRPKIRTLRRRAGKCKELPINAREPIFVELLEQKPLDECIRALRVQLMIWLDGAGHSGKDATSRRKLLGIARHRLD